MQAEMKLLDCIDGENLAAFKPEDPGSFGVWARLIAGPKGTDVEESFDFLVCTPRWLETQLGRTPLLGAIT